MSQIKLNYKFSEIFLPLFIYSLIFKIIIFLSEKINNKDFNDYLNKVTLSFILIYIISIIFISLLDDYSTYFYIFNFLINILFLFSDNANIEVFNNKNLTKFNKRYYINCCLIGYLGLMTLVYLFKQRQEISNSINWTLNEEKQENKKIN